MSLLHATWLFPPEGSGGRLLLWADTWRVAEFPPFVDLSFV